MTSPTKNINIVLAGGPNIGKTTFINSIFNYITSQTFTDATKKTPLTPALMSILLENGLTVSVGPPQNTTRIYSTPIALDGLQYTLQLLDIPGKTLENPKSVIHKDVFQLEQLDAICFFFKPSHPAEIKSSFGQFLNNFLHYFEKSIVNNVVFVCTHATTQEGLAKLKETIEEHEVQGLVDSCNVFWMDNEGFRCLALLASNIKLDDEVKERCCEKWGASRNEFYRLVSHVVHEMEPHETVKSIKFFDCLAFDYPTRFVLDISAFVDDGRRFLSAQKDSSQKNSQKLNQIVQSVTEPTDIKLKCPATICKNAKCDRTFKINNRVKVTHFRICGTEASGEYCPKCQCHEAQHHEVTTLHGILKHCTISEAKLDNAVQILDATDLMVEKYEEIVEESRRIRGEQIVTAAKRFAFLQANSVCPLVDDFQKDILSNKLQININEVLRQYKSVVAEKDEFDLRQASQERINTYGRIVALKAEAEEVKQCIKNQDAELAWLNDFLLDLRLNVPRYLELEFGSLLSVERLKRVEEKKARISFSNNLIDEEMYSDGNNIPDEDKFLLNPESDSSFRLSNGNNVPDDDKSPSNSTPI